jgi:LEA14-like dessication related protein
LNNFAFPLDFPQQSLGQNCVPKQELGNKIKRAAALILALGVVLVPLTLGGCGVGQLQQMARGEIQAPKVTYQGLKVYRPTGQGWPLGATLLLENPNSQALSLLGYDYQLWIEGRSVAQGTSQQPVNLPPQGQTVTELPIMVQLPAVLDLLPQFLPQFLGQARQPLPSRKFHYQIAGSFRLASVLGGIIPIPFKFQGEASPQEGMDFLKPHLR